MMLAERAPLWKLGRGGVPLAPLVQILVISERQEMLDHRKTS